MLDDEEYLKHIQEGQTYFNKEECKVLYDWIQNQYIDYSNIPLNEIVKKLRQIAWHG
jgi:hypothetical protein